VEQYISDESLAEQVVRGDASAFGILVERYEGKLIRYGRKFLPDREDIVDIVHDVFLMAYQHIQSFESSRRFSPWIYRIAHNAFINRLRKQGRYTTYDFDTLLSYYVAPDPAHHERERQDMHILLERGLSKISPKYREVLTLHYYEDMPYKDIADILAIPISTVSVRIKRAKEALRNALPPHDYA
jgi:RNA polymerase sigma-70 factor, ECF subfamily